ncbi:hypothetical protein, partial [Escherichia coli]|uniref:hypothetical protein n=1 Tax=Escherichia coli TaxID=562 RepID=UPI0021B4C2C6
CVEQDDKGWDARKRAYCLKIQPATGSFARNLIYSTKPQRLRKCSNVSHLANKTILNISLRARIEYTSWGIQVGIAN